MSAAPQVLTFGESMVSFRSAGPMVIGGALSTHLAGAESNVAIGLARLGHTVEWAGRASRDEFGEQVLRALRAEGVRLDHVSRDDRRPTGLMFLEQRTTDVMRVDYRRAGTAGSAVAWPDVEPAVQAGPQVLHLTGITPALSPSAREAVLRAAEAAAAAGVLVSLDVNYRARLWSRDAAGAALAEVLPFVRVVIASDDELDLVAEGAEKAAAAQLLGRGVEQVVVKHGAAGASVHTV